MAPTVPAKPAKSLYACALVALAVSLASAQEPHIHSARQGRKDFSLVPAECTARDRAKAQARFSKMKATEVESKFSQIYRYAEGESWQSSIPSTLHAHANATPTPTPPLHTTPRHDTFRHPSTGHWLKNIAPHRRPGRRGAPEKREWSPGNHSRYYSYADPLTAFKGRFSPSGR